MKNPTLYSVNVFTDSRGIFFPLDISDTSWIQSNISISKKWTFRGLHHQKGAFAQTKFITVISGSILDVLVDLRHGSFEETYFFKMNPGDQICVPKGFAHGFLALEENTIIQYLVDAPYSQSADTSFNWKSNETIKELILAEVGDEQNLSISDKDFNGLNISTDYLETIDY